MSGPSQLAQSSSPGVLSLSSNSNPTCIMFSKSKTYKMPLPAGIRCSYSMTDFPTLNEGHCVRLKQPTNSATFVTAAGASAARSVRWNDHIREHTVPPCPRTRNLRTSTSTTSSSSNTSSTSTGTSSRSSSLDPSSPSTCSSSHCASCCSCYSDSETARLKSRRPYSVPEKTSATSTSTTSSTSSNSLTNLIFEYKLYRIKSGLYRPVKSSKSIVLFCTAYRSQNKLA